MKPNNCNKDSKKNNLIAIGSRNQVERRSYVDENIARTLMKGGEYEYPLSQGGQGE
jgi:hypothetical protein